MPKKKAPGANQRGSGDLFEESSYPAPDKNQFIRTKNGHIDRNNFQNVGLALTLLGVDLWRNEQGDVMVGDELLDYPKFIHLRFEIQTAFGFIPSKSFLKDCITLFTEEGGINETQ